MVVGQPNIDGIDGVMVYLRVLSEIYKVESYRVNRSWERTLSLTTICSIPDYSDESLTWTPRTAHTRPLSADRRTRKLGRKSDKVQVTLRSAEPPQHPGCPPPQEVWQGRQVNCLLSLYTTYRSFSGPPNKFKEIFILYYLSCLVIMSFFYKLKLWHTMDTHRYLKLFFMTMADSYMETSWTRAYLGPQPGLLFSAQQTLL